MEEVKRTLRGAMAHAHAVEMRDAGAALIGALLPRDGRAGGRLSCCAAIVDAHAAIPSTGRCRSEMMPRARGHMAGLCYYGLQITCYGGSRVLRGGLRVTEMTEGPSASARRDPPLLTPLCQVVAGPCQLRLISLPSSTPVDAM